MTPNAATAIPAHPLPPGFTWSDKWEPDEPMPYRVISGPQCGVSDSDMQCAVWATQWADGTIDTDGSGGEEPHIHLAGYTLNVDQARELAGILLALTAQIDGLVQR